MNTNVDPRSAAAISNAPKQDLRAWLAQMEAAGEVTHISGAEREREIGGIVDIYQRKIGNPMVLFDDIPGYPKGHRILANLLTSIRRINMTMTGLGGALVYPFAAYAQQPMPVIGWLSAISEQVAVSHQAMARPHPSFRVRHFVPSRNDHREVRGAAIVRLVPP